MDGWIEGRTTFSCLRILDPLNINLIEKQTRRPSRPSVRLPISILTSCSRGRGEGVRGLFDSDWHLSMFALATHPLDQTTSPLREEDVRRNLPTLLISLTLISHLSHLHHNPPYSLCSRSHSIL